VANVLRRLPVQSILSLNTTMASAGYPAPYCVLINGSRGSPTLVDVDFKASLPHGNRKASKDDQGELFLPQRIVREFASISS
jgi:hypothetical protein